MYRGGIDLVPKTANFGRRYDAFNLPRTEARSLRKEPSSSFATNKNILREEYSHGTRKTGKLFGDIKRGDEEPIFALDVSPRPLQFVCAEHNKKVFALFQNLPNLFPQKKCGISTLKVAAEIEEGESKLFR